MKKFNFIWFIENYSYCWHERGEELNSPIFLVEMMQQTSWYIQIYPRVDSDSRFTSFSLNRSDVCDGPEEIAVQFELSFLYSNRTETKAIEMNKDECVFRRGDANGYAYTERLKFNSEEKDKVLDTDVLRVRCIMSFGETEVDEEVGSSARTRIGIEKISFISFIESFCALNPSEKIPFNEKSVSKDGLNLSGYIQYFKTNKTSDHVMIVEIVSDSMNISLMTCKIFLINSAGKEVEWCKIDSRNENYRKEPMRVISISNGKKNLLDQKLEFLPNDILTFRCECTLATGIEFLKIEETLYDLNFTPFLRELLYKPNVTPRPAEPKSVSDDLRSLYNNQTVSDVKLQTASKTFPAHKSVLCARSPVLTATLTSDMKEKTTECIEIDDLDDSTVDQFLLFLYTDVLENLEWESALKLYYAAVKYQVQRLKDACSSFLVINLDISKISDLLILADRHQDSNLNTAVGNFISKNQKGIFFTGEWESFMVTKPLLAAKTMQCYLEKRIDIV